MQNSIAPEFFDFPPITKDTVSGRLRANMDMLKKQTVQEHTLYKKWKYLQDQYSKHPNVSEIVKANIWTPSDINDQQRTIDEINALRPTLRYVSSRAVDPQSYDTWFTLKLFLSSFNPTMPPGRVMNFILEDDVTGKYLAVSTLASDVINLGVRDTWVGWTKENKLTDGKLQCSPTAHMVISTQPFGYNFLGGKLLASMLLTKQPRELWKEHTGTPLVGMGTTSLYGASSQYNGIPYWKTLGETKGKIMLTPDKEIYDECKPWIEHLPEYKKIAENTGGPIPGLKNKMIMMIFKEMGLKVSDYQHGFPRGVHRAKLYTNGREFLRSEIEESALILNPRLKSDADGVVEWWRPKAIRRYVKLHETDRLKPEIMYYNDLVEMTWDEARDMYLHEVGR